MCIHVKVKKCIICGEMTERYLEVLRKPICCICESRIVSTAVEEPEYFFYLHQLPKLWQVGFSSHVFAIES